MTTIFAFPFFTAVIFPLDVTFTIFLLEVLYLALEVHVIGLITGLN